MQNPELACQLNWLECQRCSSIAQVGVRVSSSLNFFRLSFRNCIRSDIDLLFIPRFQYMKFIHRSFQCKFGSFWLTCVEKNSLCLSSHFSFQCFLRNCCQIHSFIIKKRSFEKLLIDHCSLISYIVSKIPPFPTATTLEIHISYWTVQCVVSWDIFTSHAAFWRARGASQNTRDE